MIPPGMRTICGCTKRICLLLLRPLGQSLTLVPSNASNRLKLAQLRFIAGERDQANQLLLELRGERLSIEERKTLDELLAGLGMLESKPASEKTDK